MNNPYFANLGRDEIGPELQRRVDQYYDEIDRNGRWELWSKAYRTYYSLDVYNRHEAAQIQRKGEQGEYSKIKASHYRNLLTHLHVIVTQQRPAFECRATNTDTKSQIQTILGANILEYYMREKRLEEHYRQAVELCLVLGEAYMTMEWDKKLGDEVTGDLETGEVLRTGDIVVRVYAPDAVIRSCLNDTDTKQDWYITKRYENRYDLATRYPEHAEKLLQYSDDSKDRRLGRDYRPVEIEDDYIPVYTFFHDRTVSVREGRITQFVGPEIILDDTALTAPVFPVFRMAAYNQHGTSFGYSVSFDLLCVQEAIDLLYSTILSNQATFGVQNIWMPPGANIAPSQVATGLNIITSPTKPEAINLTNTPPEIFNFLKQLEQLGEMLSGVNSVARGQPEASLKSGTALALIASQAVQFSNGIQAAFTHLLEDSGTAVIKYLQKFASVPRLAAIAGKNGRSYIKEFTGQDLTGINRVVVDLGNPVSRTLSGRIQMAQDLLQSQQVDPKGYIEVVTTGRLEPLVEDKESENLLIRAENEALREGQPVFVTAIDQHVEHIKCHRAVLADPITRMDPQLVQSVLDHVLEHINALKTTDPNLLNLLGMNAILPPQPPMPGPGPGGQPPADQAAPPPNTPPDVAANMPKMPEPPQGSPEVPVSQA